MKLTCKVCNKKKSLYAVGKCKKCYLKDYNQLPKQRERRIKYNKEYCARKRRNKNEIFGGA